MSQVGILPISILLRCFTLHTGQNIPLLLVDQRGDEGGVIERRVLWRELDRWRTGDVGQRVRIGPFRGNTYLASVRLARGLILPEELELRIRNVAIGTLGMHAPRETGQIGRVLCPAGRGRHHVHHSHGVAHARAGECQAIEGAQARHGTEGVVGIHGEAVQCALEGHGRQDERVQQRC